MKNTLQNREHYINKALTSIGANITAKFVEVNKGSYTYNGFTLKSPECDAAPIIPYSEEWDELSNLQLAQKFADFYNNNNRNIDVSHINAEYIYENVLPMVVGTDSETFPNLALYSQHFLDLKIYYYINFQEDMMIRITHQMINRLDMDKYRLHECAINNLKFQSKIMEMPLPIDHMLVVTNKKTCLGACSILNPSIFNKVCKEFNTDEIYILPSSIHELICTPTHLMDCDDLKDIVSSINADIVSAEEFLSNSVYYYSTSNNEIQLVS